MDNEEGELLRARLIDHAYQLDHTLIRLFRSDFSQRIPMPKHTINWINDHTQICDRLDERVQRMQDYLDSKPDDFDGIATKQFLLGQAREQISWYQQTIEALDYVGSVACRRALETGQTFLHTTCPPTTSAKPNAARNTNATPTSRSCP